MKYGPLAILAALLSGLFALAWWFAKSDGHIDSTEREILFALASSFVVIAYVTWLFYSEWRERRTERRERVRNFEAMQGSITALHTRHGSSEQRSEHAHIKLDKLRRGLVLLFKGDTVESHKAFIEWWRSWHP